MMAIATTETASLIACTLPSTPHSVQLARSYVRATLAHHELGGYAEDAEMVISELVTNAIEHAGGPTLGLEVIRVADSAAVAVIVTDSSPNPPVRREVSADSEHGRGLRIVSALSARWGWRPESPGKAVYAILTREA